MLPSKHRMRKYSAPAAPTAVVTIAATIATSTATRLLRRVFKWQPGLLSSFSDCPRDLLGPLPRITEFSTSRTTPTITDTTRWGLETAAGAIASATEASAAATSLPGALGRFVTGVWIFLSGGEHANERLGGLQLI